LRVRMGKPPVRVLPTIHEMVLFTALVSTRFVWPASSWFFVRGRYPCTAVVFGNFLLTALAIFKKQSGRVGCVGFAQFPLGFFAEAKIAKPSHNRPIRP
jgi:hypothetical protein